MKRIIKGGMLINNRIYETFPHYNDEDEYGERGVIVYDNGDVMEYDFRGLSSEFNITPKHKGNPKPLTWVERIKKNIKNFLFKKNL